MPLRFISLAGLLTSAGAIAGAILLLLQRLFEIHIFGYAPQDMPAYTSLFLALQFFSGIQLLSLGIIGHARTGQNAARLRAVAFGPRYNHRDRMDPHRRPKRPVLKGAPPRRVFAIALQ